jgi:hypothetical protein
MPKALESLFVKSKVFKLNGPSKDGQRSTKSVLINLLKSKVKLVPCPNPVSLYSMLGVKLLKRD